LNSKRKVSRMPAEPSNERRTGGAGGEVAIVTVPEEADVPKRRGQ